MATLSQRILAEGRGVFDNAVVDPSRVSKSPVLQRLHLSPKTEVPRGNHSATEQIFDETKNGLSGDMPRRRSYESDSHSAGASRPAFSPFLRSSLSSVSPIGEGIRQCSRRGQLILSYLGGRHGILIVFYIDVWIGENNYETINLDNESLADDISACFVWGSEGDFESLDHSELPSTLACKALIVCKNLNVLRSPPNSSLSARYSSIDILFT